MAPSRAVDDNGRASHESKNFIFIIIKVAQMKMNHEIGPPMAVIGGGGQITAQGPITI